METHPGDGAGIGDVKYGAVDGRMVVNGCRSARRWAPWSPQLTGRSFHVRFHRRGPKYDLVTQHTEHSLNETILDTTAKLGAQGNLSFTDPDVVIAIDTIDDRAGLALWTRDDLSRHRLLRPD